jgi:hypothetical protein
MIDKSSLMAEEFSFSELPSRMPENGPSILSLSIRRR